MNQNNSGHQGYHPQFTQGNQNFGGMSNNMHQQTQQQYPGNQNQFQFNADFHQQLMQASGQTNF